MNTKPLNDAPTRNELIDFLEGISTIDGVSFGERHPVHAGLFWWRKFLTILDRANTPDSCSPTSNCAARGAMTVIDKDNLRNILDDIRKQNCPAMDDARITIEGWLLSDLIVVQSDATAQPIDLTGERIAIQKIRELCKASVMVTTYDVEQILDALANTNAQHSPAQGKTEQDSIDAQRYRYAVANGVILFDFGSVACVGRAEADKAIDAALAAKKG